MSTALPLYRRATVAVVDDADYEWLSASEWRLATNGYVVRCESGLVTTYLHREIMGLAVGDERQVDHVNRDKLDNRRVNLRVVTSAQQSQNVPGFGGSSRFRGVSYRPDYGRRPWVARATVDRVGHYIGAYATEQEAAAAAAAFRVEAMPFTIEGLAA